MLANGSTSPEGPSRSSWLYFHHAPIQLPHGAPCVGFSRASFPAVCRRSRFCHLAGVAPNTAGAYLLAFGPGALGTGHHKPSAWKSSAVIPESSGGGPSGGGGTCTIRCAGVGAAGFSDSAVGAADVGTGRWAGVGVGVAAGASEVRAEAEAGPGLGAYAGSGGVAGDGAGAVARFTTCAAEALALPRTADALGGSGASGGALGEAAGLGGRFQDVFFVCT